MTIKDFSVAKKYGDSTALMVRIAVVGALALLTPGARVLGVTAAMIVGVWALWNFQFREGG